MLLGGEESVLALELLERLGHLCERLGVGALDARRQDFGRVDLLELAIVVGVECDGELVLDVGRLCVRDEHVLLRVGLQCAQLEVDAVALLSRAGEEHLGLLVLIGQHERGQEVRGER